MKIKFLTITHDNLTSADNEACDNNLSAWNQVVEDVPTAIDIMSYEGYDGVPDCVKYSSAQQNAVTSTWGINNTDLPVTFLLTGDDAVTWSQAIRLQDNTKATIVNAAKTVIQQNGIPGTTSGDGSWNEGDGSGWFGDGSGFGLGLVKCESLGPLKFICDIKLPGWVWLVGTGFCTMKALDAKTKPGQIGWAGLAGMGYIRFLSGKKKTP